MDKEIIFTPDAPQPAAAYSQAVRAGKFVFFSGQIPIDPKTKELVLGDIGDQAKVVMDNLSAVVRAAGCSMDDIVKATIYLTDMSQFSKVNEVYARYFSAEPPARACVGVASLPKGVGIEIEAIAINK